MRRPDDNARKSQALRLLKATKKDETNLVALANKVVEGVHAYNKLKEKTLKAKGKPAMKDAKVEKTGLRSRGMQGHHLVPISEGKRGAKIGIEEKIRRLQYHLSNLYDQHAVRDIPVKEHTALHAPSKPLVKRELDPKEGVTFTHEEDIDWDKPKHLKIRAHKDGKQIGYTTIDNRGRKYITSRDVEVHPDHRRKGVATGMYQYAERVTGKELKPSSDRTKAGTALWQGTRSTEGKGRPFGAGTRGVRSTYRPLAKEVAEGIVEQLQKVKALITMPHLGAGKVHQTVGYRKEHYTHATERRITGTTRHEPTKGLVMGHQEEGKVPYAKRSFSGGIHAEHGADLGTQQHETQHALFHQVGDEHGRKMRHAAAKHLVESIPASHKDTFMRITDIAPSVSRAHPDMKHEERVSFLHSYLNSSEYRGHVHKYWQKEGVDPRHVDKHLKEVHAHMRRVAQDMKPEHLIKALSEEMTKSKTEWNDRGWISPGGRVHRVGLPYVPHDDHIGFASDRAPEGMHHDEAVDHLHSKGWISFGHGAGGAISGHSKYLNNRSHPATQTAHKLLGSSGLEEAEIHHSDTDEPLHRVNVDQYIKHGLKGRRTLVKGLFPPVHEKYTMSHEENLGGMTVEAHTHEGEHVGTADFEYHPKENTMRGTGLYVHEAHKKSGLANAMVRHAELASKRKFSGDIEQSHRSAAFWDALGKTDIPKGPQGECFRNALRHTMDHGEPGMEVVHGKAHTLEGKEIDHAWVEHGDHVIDPTAGVKVPKTEYYKAVKAKPVSRYTPHQAMINMVRAKHHGPWEEHEIKKNDPINAIFDVHGIQVNVEWPKGSTREYKDGYKKEMKCHYGYIARADGDDGEELDVYLGDHLDSKRVFLIKQNDTNGGEEKIMLGFKTPECAKQAFLTHMEEKNFGGMREMCIEELKGRVIKKPESLPRGVQAADGEKHIVKRLEALKEAIQNFTPGPSEVEDLRLIVKKLEILKGAMQRLAPYKPSVMEPVRLGAGAKHIAEWQEGSFGSGHQAHREAIPRIEGNERVRALHRLSGSTKVRTASDGKREFLLHRGMSTEEHDKTGGGLQHQSKSSWTPNHRIAHGLGGDIHGVTVSAWVHEDKIHHVPKQIGSPRTVGAANLFANEHEVIVDKDHNSKRAHPLDVPQVSGHQDIHSRISERGKMTHKSEDMDKGLKHVVAAAGAAAAMAIPATANRQAHASIPRPAHVQTQRFAPEGAHPHDKFLSEISRVESTSGKFTQHKQMTHGMHAGTAAIGRYGLMPHTVQYVAHQSKNKEIQALGQHDHPTITAKLKADPGLEHEVAREYAGKLHELSRGNETKMAYRWLHGHNAKVSTEEAKEHPYVKEYLKGSK